MELVDDKKLEEVANFLTDIEVDGNYLCEPFLEFLDGSFNAPKCTDYDGSFCAKNCPVKSPKEFIKWIKKPERKIHVEDLERPKQEDFIGFDNRSGRFALSGDYVQALEKYCNDLENILADTEYDLETAECDNRELTEKLEKIRGILDEHD